MFGAEPRSLPLSARKKRGERGLKRKREQQREGEQKKAKASERSIARSFLPSLPLPLTSLRPEPPQPGDHHGRRGHAPHALAAVDRQLPRVEILVDDVVGVVVLGVRLHRRRRRRFGRHRCRSHHSSSSSGARGAGSLGLGVVQLLLRRKERFVVLLLLVGGGGLLLSRGHEEGTSGERENDKGREREKVKQRGRGALFFFNSFFLP